MKLRFWAGIIAMATATILIGIAIFIVTLNQYGIELAYILGALIVIFGSTLITILWSNKDTKDGD